MKKILFVLLALCFASSLAFAQNAAQPVVATTATETAAVVATDTATPEAMVLKGDIIDNMCAGKHKETLAEFVKTHTKECALMPDCVASGYSLFADGKLYAFDQDSNAKVAEFLKNADSKLQVTVTAKQVGDELSLASIENQK
ncbi:MAG: hypothetical protein PHR73_01785 [Candidatus Omnitrophica bacterium]|nr:hypothetical protein [Candidatus Omnitrophota bacterium]